MVKLSEALTGLKAMVVLEFIEIKVKTNLSSYR